MNIRDVLPVLSTIYEQQQVISNRLQKLIETFKREPEPVEPVLRLMLSPIKDGMTEMHQILSPTSNPEDYSASPSE